MFCIWIDPCPSHPISSEYPFGPNLPKPAPARRHAKGTRVNALPKPSGHILSSERCAACHAATTFAPAVRFDHAEALGNCASCHNGQQAAGKPPGHIPTSESCESCHKAFKPDLTSMGLYKSANYPPPK